MTRGRFILGATCALVLTLIVLALSAALQRCDAGEPADVSGYAIRGIDISHHNGRDIDFGAVAGAGYRFVYIKASEGTDYKDRHFVDNIRRAREAGLDVGVYHFFRFDTDGEMQAINLLHSLHNRNIDLPVAIDIEEWGNPDGEGTSRIIGRLRAMLDVLEREGVDVIIYTNKDGYDRFVRGNFDSYPLWLSSFTRPDRDIGMLLWQHSHSGSVPGIPGKTDLNVFTGSEAEYQALTRRG